DIEDDRNIGDVAAGIDLANRSDGIERHRGTEGVDQIGTVALRLVHELLHLASVAVDVADDEIDRHPGFQLLHEALLGRGLAAEQDEHDVEGLALRARGRGRQGGQDDAEEKSVHGRPHAGLSVVGLRSNQSSNTVKMVVVMNVNRARIMKAPTKSISDIMAPSRIGPLMFPIRSTRRKMPTVVAWPTSRMLSTQ